jgi:hypothetical protein
MLLKMVRRAAASKGKTLGREKGFHFPGLAWPFVVLELSIPRGIDQRVTSLGRSRHGETP